MPSGIDCASKITKSIADTLIASGYTFVGRYLVPQRGSLRYKALTKTEARIIAESGLRLLTVYETTANRPAGGAQNGDFDGSDALAVAKEIEMPTDGIIYFAVDYDADDFDAIESYLRAARKKTGPYEIGVYGSYKVVEEMRKRNACKCFWQCIAWSYGKVSKHYNVYQHIAEVMRAGINVDINDCPDMDEAGIWTYEEFEYMNIDKMIEDMSNEQAYMLMQKANAHAATLPPSNYAIDACKKAVDSGLFMDDNGDGIMEKPRSPILRQELATVLDRKGLLD